MTDLGKLKPVALTSEWPDEARDFTPWLAKKEGMELIGEALGMDLELVDTEVAVGNYRADIVAKDAASDEKVVIENQLRPTDHDHIGKLITYAAVVEAGTVVWIAERIREEHRRAIDWLNNWTSEGLDFFAVEIELWRIGNSAPAPRLSIVSRPNQLAKAFRSGGGGATTKGAVNQLEFWGGFVEYLKDSGSPISRRKPQPQNWFDVAIGKSGVHITLTVRFTKKDVGCDLYIETENAKAIFHALRDEKEAIEAEVGNKLNWREIPHAKSSRIELRKKFDLEDTEQWPEAHAWLAEHAMRFKKAFAERVKKAALLPADNGDDTDDE